MHHAPSLTSMQIQQARLRVLDGVETATAALDPIVVRSWQRSAAAGVLPEGKGGDTAGDAGDLPHLLDDSAPLLRHAQPVIEYLVEQVYANDNLVLLANAQGHVLQTQGDTDFLDKAHRVALRPGANWAEHARGTNAIGLALAEEREAEVHGAEHFLDRNGFLTCTAAPLWSGQGKLLGVLDLSGDHRNRHPYARGLVTMAARMIENSLLLQAQAGVRRVLLHARPEGLGTVAQGIIMVSEDDWLVGANRRGLELLGLTRSDIAGIRWTTLFDQPIATLLQSRGKGTQSGGRLRLRAGTELHAQLVESERPITIAVSAVPASAPLPSADPLLAQDAQWSAAALRARRVFDKAVPLLVLGESGVGKEVFARALHGGSARTLRPFVAVNCAALPEHLIEAELFGYVAGAFTGALRQGATGRLREAHGGTLFLDEIGDMPVGLQTRLLRVLQDRAVTPLGGGEPVPVDFALVCATHQNLRAAVDQGRFRADLYYRINGLSVQLPPLRERTDFVGLARTILRELAPVADIVVEPALLVTLQKLAWPGNVRQLANVLRAASALLEAGEQTIRQEHLPEDLLRELRDAGAGPLHPVEPVATTPMRQMQMRTLEQALSRHQGNVSAVARELGISRQTIYRYLRDVSPQA